MNLNTLVERAAKRVEEIPYLSGIPVIVEEKGDTANRLQVGIAKTKFAVIVGWNGFESGANSSRTVYGKARLVVSVYEQPVVNRKSEGVPTLLNAAQEIAKELNLFTAEGGNAPIVFRKITPISELGDGKTVACDVEFETESTL